jgi:hypothetical protein
MRVRHAALSALCAAAAVAALTPASAIGRSGDAEASAFAVRTVRLLVANRYAAAWQSLHPSHQRATGGRERYVRCELETAFAFSATRVEGLSVSDETVSIAGIGRIRTKAVTILVAFGADLAPVRPTVHVVLVHGMWRWVLPRARYVNYRRGVCG